MEVQNLNISYRQSEELLELADKIYQEERGTKSPYECYLKGRQTPKPLWLEIDDLEEKADWISHRVLEIVKAYDNKMLFIQPIIEQESVACLSLQRIIDT